MNEHVNDHFDHAIDRATRQLVEHDPPPTMHAAVMSDIRARTTTGASWVRWTLVATPVAATVILALIVWSQPRKDAYREPAPQHATVAHTPVHNDAQRERPAAPPTSVRRERRRATSPAVAPAVSGLAGAVAPVEVPQISLKSVQVSAIPLDEVAIPPIRIRDIAIDPQQE